MSLDGNFFFTLGISLTLFQQDHETLKLFFDDSLYVMPFHISFGDYGLISRSQRHQKD